METPSSTRRITRSQTRAAAAAGNDSIPISKKFEDSEKKGTKGKQKTGKQQERSALIDITNDSSPIIGLAMETPSSMVSKRSVKIGLKTPGSGEALLRGQVKTLLQKVEEEAELSKPSLEQRLFFHHLPGSVNSPNPLLLAPTPANTPCLDPSGNVLPSVAPSPVEDKFVLSQMFVGEKEESETEESKLTRSLLLDFSEKSEATDSSECSSMLTYESTIRGGEADTKEKGTNAADDDDDDVSSIWSIQVNASSVDDNDEEGEVLEDECDEEHYEDEEAEADNGELLDELCQGISKMGINGEAKFAGKHTRFVYNSDDEIEGLEEDENATASSPGILHLKGLPTPTGKHLRFQQQEEN